MLAAGSGAGIWSDEARLQVLSGCCWRAVALLMAAHVAAVGERAGQVCPSGTFELFLRRAPVRVGQAKRESWASCMSEMGHA